MRKIPVWDTVRRAYSFAFGRFDAVIGVMWLPVLLSCVAGYFLFRDVVPPTTMSTDSQTNMIAWVGFYFSLMGPLRWFELVLWAMTIMIEIGLTRAALGIGPTPYVFFTLGPPFWRMLGANLIFATILVIALIPIVLVAVGLSLIAPMAKEVMDPNIGVEAAPWVIVVIVAVGIAALVTFYYIYARLWFFIAPVVVAESHIDIRRSWHLGKGNVWRIIGVLLCIVIPGFMVLAAAEGVALWTIMANIPYAQFPTAQVFSDNWVVFDAVIVVIVMLWILLTAMLQGARAFAYRAITESAGNQAV